KGEYRVTYTLIDAGIEVQQTLDVQVAATVTPASDLVWQSATSGWKTVNKDSAVSVTDPIKLNIDGIVQTFEKGIGAAANAEIVYDLTGTEYEYFTSYVGTDKNFNDTRTTVQFSVLADGVEVYRSSEMGQYSQAEFINLPITGVKELRLIADNVDGDGLGDFTSWGDPQFITVDSKPTLTGVEATTILPFHSKLDLLEGIEANDVEDGDLTSQITVETNGFDSNIPGVYPVTYTVTDSEGNATSQTREITVYSKQTYASDITWQSATSGWKTVNKDSAVSTTNPIKLNVDGEIQTFTKGIGAAANAEIVYDLSGADYEYFTSYVGTDKNYDDTRTTIEFSVFADGVEVYRSSKMGQYSQAEFIHIPVSGVQELRLIADNVDGNGLGDFTSWGDAQFITTNSKPTLTGVETTTIVPFQSEFDLLDGIEANDVEDGDLTSKIAVEANGFDINVPGIYPITYTVTDANGNTVEQQREITVYSKQTYASDITWQSATSGWKTVNKDSAVSTTNPIKLNVDGEIQTFTKGIGAAATAEIVYDLSGADYEYFTSYVGTDKNFDDSRTTIQFS
ncbi:MAG: NPCBM/NEW2 domain-containing protein, partial [Culicoidibacterales bacterium]